MTELKPVRDQGPPMCAGAAPPPPPAKDMLSTLAAHRVAIEGVSPEINGGRFKAKSAVGRPFTVEADIFCDGHDVVRAALLTRRTGTDGWTETAMTFLVNDRWRASVVLDENAPHDYTLIGWKDPFASWRTEVSKKHAAGQRLTLELEEGRAILERTAAESERASVADKSFLKRALEAYARCDAEGDRLSLLMGEDLLAVMQRAGIRQNLTWYERTLQVYVDRELGLFGAWYELFPRSQSDSAERHGTLDDVIAKLPYVRDLGFDVLYFPPIHPIGRTNRKGRNNSLNAAPDDPGSPYAIGSHEGGHDALHPELGSFEDFARLIAAARAHGLEIAIDFAIQCAPDHPWIREHKDWFDWRPDGSLKYAENPPKKYEDIVNVDFYGPGFPELWYALRDVVLFWLDKGVRIFRVDNPHTKPYPFWEWLISEVQARDPGAIFLAEAFTRPKVMKRLAKLGYTQSYSYFTWRNVKGELTEYLTELTQTDCRHTMRPNFFVNTPDINPFYLQISGRAGFQVRLILAATLATSYGVYSGFELCEAAALPGREEYLDSEKYQIRVWDWDRPGNIKEDIRRINALRNTHRALREFDNLTFYNAWNDNILYYGKRTADLASFLLIAVNLDPHNAQGAHFEVPLWEFGLPDQASIEVEDCLTGSRFTWHGKVQHMFIDPYDRPYFIWRLIPPGAPR